MFVLSEKSMRGLIWDDPVLEQIRDEVKQLDINNLTPLEALNKLSEIKRLVGGK